MILQNPPPSKATAPLQEDKQKILASIKEDLCLKYYKPLSYGSNASDSKYCSEKSQLTTGTKSLQMKAKTETWLMEGMLKRVISLWMCGLKGPISTCINFTHDNLQY